MGRCGKDSNSNKGVEMTRAEMKQLVLTVNGSEIQMNDFVRRIVTNILSSILDSLKLDGTPKSAVFTISEKLDK